ncbi:MAG: hypothetical protein P4L56_27160 [Candidatus Sulfopaludibacter sp.]|nr:hypothetical protein [Candidatus Sulfopaludibacter sp.]
MLTKLLITGLLATTLVFAQRGGGGGGGGGMGGESMGGMGGGGGSMVRVNRMEMITDMLKLNKDQKKLVKTTLDEGQKSAAPVREQLAKGRKAIAEAVASGSQDSINSAVNNYAAAEAQMATIELQAFAKIYPALEKDQQQHGGQFFAMMNGIFKGKNWNE